MCITFRPPWSEKEKVNLEDGQTYRRAPALYSHTCGLGVRPRLRKLDMYRPGSALDGIGNVSSQLTHTTFIATWPWSSFRLHPLEKKNTRSSGGSSGGADDGGSQNPRDRFAVRAQTVGVY